MKAEYTIFGETKLIPLVVRHKGEEIQSKEWDETLWIERGEDWYALSSPQLRDKRVRIVERSVWLKY
jgi:hypothetical protein